MSHRSRGRQAALAVAAAISTLTVAAVAAGGTSMKAAGELYVPKPDHGAIAQIAALKAAATGPTPLTSRR